MLSQLDLESKGHGHSKNQKPMPWGTKNMPPKKNLSRGSLSNWCDADADTEADISKTMRHRRPHPTGGPHNYIIQNKKIFFQECRTGQFLFLNTESPAAAPITDLMNACKCQLFLP